MPLVKSLSYHNEIINAPPVRLDDGEITVPQQVELTYTGIIHDARFNSLDFLPEMLKEHHVLAYEVNEWTPADLVRHQRIAKGYPKAQAEQDKLIARLAQIEQTTGQGQAQWDAVCSKALYRSGVRVFFPDYPKGHPSLADNDIAIQRHGRDLQRDRNPEEASMKIMAARDTYIARALCEGIEKLRREDPISTSQIPLRVLMLFGYTHLAVPDLLRALAKKQNNDTFHAVKLFEPPAVCRADITDELMEAFVSNSISKAHFYQNWLRTPETP